MSIVRKGEGGVEKYHVTDISLGNSNISASES